MFDRFIPCLSSIEPNYRDKKFLLAVSGGIDSMLLLELFYAAKLNFSIAHCNFNLRGDASDKDEAFVISKGILKGATTFAKHFNTKDILSQSSSKSLQMLARDLRYDWFKDLVELHDFDHIVTAHHLNDSIETFIYNFSKGTGIKGLTGIPPQNGKIIRPLSIFTKKEIKAYATQTNLPYREDASNAKSDYKRNQIRNDIIPSIEIMNPAFVSNASRTIKHLKEARLVYEDAIKTAKNESVSIEGGATHVDIQSLRNYVAPTTLLFEILSPFGFSFDTVDSIIKIGPKGTGQQFFTNDYSLLFNRSQLIIEKTDLQKIEKVYFSPLDKAVSFNNIQFELKIIERKKDFVIKKDKQIAYLDLDLLSKTLEIRTWKDGDKFQPYGMKGKHQKLQDYFSNIGLNRNEKNRLPIFVSNNSICWVAFERIDEKFKITPQSKTILQISKSLR